MNLKTFFIDFKMSLLIFLMYFTIIIFWGPLKILKIFFGDFFCRRLIDFFLMFDR